MDKLGPNSVIQSEEGFIEAISFSDNVLTMWFWPYLVSMINRANDLLWQKKVKDRHCYVGKELISSGQVFFAISPPNSKKMRKITLSLVEVGIYKYWRDESIQLAYSQRVQDRVKVVSPTRLKYNNSMTAFTALGMKGKVLTVFFLWAVCILLSCTCFVMEKWVVKRFSTWKMK